MALLSWKKDVIAIGYDLLIDGNLVGEIKNERLSNNSYVKVKERKYFFETIGMRHKRINIIDMNRRKEIGQIIFNLWHTKATITLYEKEYEWKSDYMFHRKWSLSSKENDTLIESKLYKGDSHQIKNEVDELLVFCGIVTLVRLRHNVG